MNRIRVGTVDDVHQIAQLLVSTWRSAYSSFLPISILDQLNIQTQEKRHRQYLSNGITYFVAIDSEGNVNGFCSYGPDRLKRFDVELYTIYVATNFQGLGIGQRLLNKVLEENKSDHHQIGVSVFKDNPFLKFYLKNHFKIVDQENIKLNSLSISSLILMRNIT